MTTAKLGFNLPSKIASDACAILTHVLGNERSAVMGSIAATVLAIVTLPDYDATRERQKGGVLKPVSQAMALGLQTTEASVARRLTAASKFSRQNWSDLGTLATSKAPLAERLEIIAGFIASKGIATQENFLESVGMAKAGAKGSEKTEAASATASASDEATTEAEIKVPELTTEEKALAEVRKLLELYPAIAADVAASCVALMDSESKAALAKLVAPAKPARQRKAA